MDNHAAPLAGRTVLVIGGARGLGRGIAEAAARAGAAVVVGARDADRAAQVAATLPGATSALIDIGDERSIAEAAATFDRLDHVVVTASAHHDVPVTGYQHDAVVRAFQAKVIGPMLVAKHLAPRLAPDGSILLFSGVAAWNPSPGYTVMGVTNAAVAALATHLAVELAPVRVNAISPGIVDSGTWDTLGEGAKASFFAGAAGGTLVGRVGRTDDITEAALWLLTAGYVSGETIHVEGGARHA
ncbi:SDR family oxidoreductase [Cellulomonas soli]|uniref:Short-chain dehydrogenase n=1 Tax=Cellulomonas soli TaxID=931535 RepID=A0A512P8F1_9CELL|nr:SDR family oxidoreductase [Cellulomonas soli]NYI57701.1 NAD(P)-dependent dehydrogenase (short-subunit alcohol dehydrogenase family) [Cellulomonas soli]GEP67481.1 short-chain dehydrogenase [Cellulomonas soli]